jgi:hypothetical protein
MVNERGFWLAGNNGHLQCLQRQLGCDPYSECPADTLSTKCVDHYGQVDPARGQSHEGEIRQPQLVWSRWNELGKIGEISGDMPAAPLRPP